MTGKNNKKLAIGIGLVVGILFIVSGSKELIQSRQLRAHGKIATAEVLNGEDRVSGRLRHHRYHLQVRFQMENGATSSQSVEVNEGGASRKDWQFRPRPLSPRKPVHLPGRRGG